MSRTFSIIKPDATNRNLLGAINKMIEEAGSGIVAQRRIHMSDAQAKKFYEVHAERPFYGELVEFVTSAPVVVWVLEGDDAVAKYRTVMGATNPAEADEGTFRKAHALSIVKTLFMALILMKMLPLKSPNSLGMPISLVKANSKQLESISEGNVRAQ